MTPESGEESFKSLERKLSALMLRFSDIERRLKRLEQKVFPELPSRVLKPQPPREGMRHTYLARAITSAKRDYEQKSG
jgi:hypothetical protein